MLTQSLDLLSLGNLLRQSLTEVCVSSENTSDYRNIDLMCMREVFLTFQVSSRPNE